MAPRVKDKASLIVGAGLIVEALLVVAAVMHASKRIGEPIVVASGAGAEVVVGTIQGTLTLLFAVIAASLVVYYAVRHRRVAAGLVALGLVVAGGVAFASAYPGSPGQLVCHEDPVIYYEPAGDRIMLATNCTLIARIGGGTMLIDPGVHELDSTLIEEREYRGIAAVEVFRLALEKAATVSNGTIYTLGEAGSGGRSLDMGGVVGDPWVTLAQFYEGEPVWVVADSVNTSVATVFDPGSSTLTVYILTVESTLNLSYDGEEYSVDVLSNGEPVLVVKSFHLDSVVMYRFAEKGGEIVLEPVEIVVGSGATVAP